ncbi:hypothetical protein [Flavobacterium sp. LC2016-12]|uniref:hypothetical protein n=1 Tax=Flavobacterium sp. LC2016-12 TaxID=2783794 RepID=UPI00188A26A2|nr:hypothetical protein [Flavobacterium sp. LC2016-12]MBF4467446.1 hypothetical protein [Flavobacterium sp. LC2016-12]
MERKVDFVNVVASFLAMTKIDENLCHTYKVLKTLQEKNLRTLATQNLRTLF